MTTPPVEQPAPVMIDDPDNTSRLQMQLFTLGNISFVCLGCELYNQIGRDIKKAMPAEHTVVITHTPGYVGDNPWAVGYVVDKSSLDTGNKKLYSNLKPGFYDEQIVEEAVNLYNLTK